ncbi:MAG: hypothetical protein JWN46_3958, partial [Acidimicrobiales bacterium]|nr:hypothetical protein [Acidimicrobiales bacterium]
MPCVAAGRLARFVVGGEDVVDVLDVVDRAAVVGGCVTFAGRVRAAPTGRVAGGAEPLTSLARLATRPTSPSVIASRRTTAAARAAPARAPPEP